MADSDQYYNGLSDDHKRMYFPARFYTERIAALEAKIVQLESGSGGMAPPNEELAAARQKIAALEARIVELEQQISQAPAPATDAQDAVKEEAVSTEPVKEDAKQAARKTKGRKKDATDGGDDGTQ